MASLTKVKINNIDTSRAYVSDPLVILNFGSTLANTDIGFIFNRDGGVSSNVAVFWDETRDRINIAYTSDTGLPNSNVTVSQYANVAAAWYFGNLAGGTTGSVFISANILPTANGFYSLGSSTATINAGYFGNVYAAGYFYANGAPFVGGGGGGGGTGNVNLPIIANSFSLISDANGNISIGTGAAGPGQGDYAVAIGTNAGNTTQGAYSVAIGSDAAANAQGSSAVAIGDRAGYNTQGSDSVAIGYYAAHDNQGSEAVAIGYSAADTSQSSFAVAIGYTAGQTNQGLDSIAIGFAAGQNTQGQDSIAMGYASGSTTQGNLAIALGYNAGSTLQADKAIAIGNQTGETNQSIQSVAIGDHAGQNYQGNNSVAIGSFAGQNYLPANSIVISATGAELSPATAGFYVAPIAANASPGNVLYYNTVTNEITYGVAPAGGGGNAFLPIVAISANLISDVNGNISIGTGAGSISQGLESVAIGDNAGNDSQGDNSIAIGSYAASSNQGVGAVAVGYYAGNTAQGDDGVAIGDYAGNDSQGQSAVAIGVGAGQISQGVDAVAIGDNAGQSNQGPGAVAQGLTAGYTSQGVSAVAIGESAGKAHQGNTAVALGHLAGEQYQGENSVAIGHQAGKWHLPANAIVISATGSNLSPATAGFYVAPIAANASPGDVLYYNTTTNEITYGAAPAGGGGGSNYSNANVAAYLISYQGDILADTVTANVFTTLGNVGTGNITGVNTLFSINGNFTGNVLAGGGIYNRLSVNGNVAIKSNLNATLASATLISADGVSIAPNNSGVLLQLVGQTIAPARLYIDGVGSPNYPAIVGRHYNGTTASPLELAANDIISRYAATPYTTAGWPAISTTRIDMVADETQTGTNQGSRIEFWITPKGSNVIQKSATFGANGIQSNGNIYFGAGLVDYSGSPGTSGQVLTSTGAGVDWADLIDPVAMSLIFGGGGGGGGGDDVWTDLGSKIYYGGNVAIGYPIPTAFSNVTIYHTTPSTSADTGALQVCGGLGVDGNIFTLGIVGTNVLNANTIGTGVLNASIIGADVFNANTLNANVIAANTLSAIGISASTLAGALTSPSQTAITGLGTITTGTWNASTVDVLYGGTGATTATGALTNLLPAGAVSGYVLTTGGTGSYYWAAGGGGGGGGGVVGQSLTTLRQANTATAGQTLFTLIGRSYTPGTGQLRVYVDGTRLDPSQYTETSNVSYTLANAVNSGQTVFAEIDAFSTFNNYANLTYASNVGNINVSGLTVQTALASLETGKATLASPVFTEGITAPTVRATAVYANGTTISTSTTSGVLRAAGGAGIAGNLNVGTAGAVSGAFHNFVGNITQSTSGGAVYINTTGNVVAAQGSFGSINSTGFVNTTGNVSAGGGALVAGNLTLGTVGVASGGFHTIRGNISQVTTGGAVYFNTTGNILAASGIFSGITASGPGHVNFAGNLSAGGFTLLGGSTQLGSPGTAAGVLHTIYGNISLITGGGPVYFNTAGNILAGGLSAFGNTVHGVAGAISGQFHTFVGNITQTSSGGVVYFNTTGNLSVGGNTALAGNVTVGTVGAVAGAFHTVIGNINQRTSGGAVYINTTGNVLAAGVNTANITVTSGNINVVGGYFVGNGAALSGISSYTPTYSALPPTGVSAGAMWIDSDDGAQYIYINDGDSFQWVEFGPFAGARGYTGAITLGTVTAISANGTPSVVNSSSDTTNGVFDFSLPIAPIVSVGTVTTSSPGGAVLVTNSGTYGNVVLNFTLPQGNTGPRATSIPYPSNAENITFFYTATALTVSRISSVLTGGTTPSVTFSIRYSGVRSATGTEVVTGGIVCGDTGIGIKTTTFNSATISANSWVWITTTAMSGNPTSLAISVDF